MKPDQKIQELHQTYVALSHMDVALRFNRESSWVEFTRAGFTKADLEAVLQRLVRLVREGERRPECLKFSNVIEGLDRFEEELAMIKAEGKGLDAGERKMSVMDLQRVIDAKESECASLKFSFAFEDSFGLNWTHTDALQKFRKLKKEIRDIQHQIAGMA